MSGVDPVAGGFLRQLLRGSAWTVLMRWSMRLVGLASTIVLARLLLPEDFGVVAMASIVVALLEAITFTGVGMALIRDAAAGRDHYDTAWTVQILQGLIVAAALLLAAPAVGAFFNEPRVVAVIQLLALKAPLRGFENIGVVAFQKELDFAKDFRFNLYRSLINFVVIVAAALLLRNYWALAVGAVSAAAINLLLSYRMHPYRPRLSLAKFREIWHFSQWVLVANVGIFFNMRVDQLVVGNALSTTAMGRYHVASELGTMPTTELMMPVRRAFFPIVSRLQNEPGEFAAAVTQTLAWAALIGCPLGFGLAAVADAAVLTLLGERWREAIPLVRWLALFGLCIGLINISGVPLYAQGKTRWIALRVWLQPPLLIPLLYFFTHRYGAEGAAATRALFALAALPVMLWLTARVCTLRFGALCAVLWRPLLAGVAMAGGLALLPSADPPLLDLVVRIAAGAPIYGVFVLLLWLCAGRPDGAEALLLRRAVRFYRQPD